MSMQDPLADMLTRIRNAQMALKADVDIPSSKTKVAIAGILEEEGYIDSAEVVEEGNHPVLRIKLKYYQGKPVIEELKRVSKPGLRIYKGADDLGYVKKGLGISILSTNQGIMTDHSARKLGIGGEVLCQVS